MLDIIKSKDNIYKLFFLVVMVVIMGLTWPHSYNILRSSLLTQPAYVSKNFQSIVHFSKIYTQKKHSSISGFHPKATKDFALFLMQLMNKGVFNKDEQQALGNHILVMLNDLHYYYPYDGLLSVARAHYLYQNQQFNKAYDHLRASYDMSKCYIPTIKYRLLLADKYGLFVQDHRVNDLKIVETGSC